MIFLIIQCDLSDFNNAEKLFKNLGDISIDILVNNSGISVLGLLQDITDNEWIRLWNTNVTSAIAMSKMIIPIFLKQGYGKIINISSVWGQRGASYEVCYSTTKGAIDSFTKALAKELAPSNIQVNAISCGIIDTKMNGHLTQEDVDSIIEEIPASRLAQLKMLQMLYMVLSIQAPMLQDRLLPLTADGRYNFFNFKFHRY